MNKLVIAILISLTTFSISQVHAQQFQVGLKGGVNRVFGGEIKGADSALPLNYTNDTFRGEGKIGYQGGGWLQVNFGKFFVRPEVVYSKLESKFDFPQGPSLYEVEELSIPFLLGYSVYEPIDVYAGIAYKNIISASIERLESNSGLPEEVVQNTPFSAQVGIKAQFGLIGVDVRYDYSLSSAETYNADFMSNSAEFNFPTVNRATIKDARLNQLIVSLTLKLFDSKSR